MAKRKEFKRLQDLIDYKIGKEVIESEEVLSLERGWEPNKDGFPSILRAVKYTFKSGKEATLIYRRTELDEFGENKVFTTYRYIVDSATQNRH